MRRPERPSVKECVWAPIGSSAELLASMTKEWRPEGEREEETVGGERVGVKHKYCLGIIEKVGTWGKGRRGEKEKK